MNIETLTEQELLIIATYCNSDERKKDVQFNKSEIKKLGQKLLIEISAKLHKSNILKIKRFLVTYKYTDRTDVQLHEDLVIASDIEDAVNKVCAAHNYSIEWHTVKEIFTND